MTATELKRVLADLGDPDIAARSLRFFKTGPGEYGEGDRFRGIRVPPLRRLARTHDDLSVAQARRLLQSAYHEDRLLALLILVRQFKRGEPARQKAIYDLYLDHTHRVNGWDLVDCSAEHIVGGWLLTRSRRPLYRLAGCERLWDRRISIMATFHFIRHRDFDDTLELADRLLKDPEDLMHKAVGWMLREVGNRDRRRQQEWLATRYQVMPRTMLRYAIEKFPEPVRQDYLKGRI